MQTIMSPSFDNFLLIVRVLSYIVAVQGSYEVSLQTARFHGIFENEVA